MFDIDNIFPCPDSTYKILEPHKCYHVIDIPSVITGSGNNLIVRKLISKDSVTIYYEYENIMRWEYELIFDFFRRKKGQYEDFYVVMWDFPYNVVGFGTNPDRELQLDTLHMLTASTGYIGNTLLAYNTRFDPKQSEVDKKELTIESIDSFNNVVTFAQDGTPLADPLPENLVTTDTVLYIVTPVIFATNSLRPRTVNTCIDKTLRYFRGYGNKYQSGPIISVAVSFTSLATFPGSLT